MRAYLGLGSNEGDRLGLLRAAREGLGAEGLRVVASSSVYETAPQGEIPDQPDFLNACLAVETELGPVELLAVCKGVERSLGREPGGRRHGPRPIDVDLLLVEGVEQRSEELALPHPDLTTRRFVLEPLVELNPELELPDGTPLLRLLPRVSEQHVERIGSL